MCMCGHACVCVLKLFRLDNTRGTEPLLAASQTHWSPYLHTVTLRYSNSQSHCSEVTHTDSQLEFYTLYRVERGRKPLAVSPTVRTRFPYPSSKVTLKSVCASGKRTHENRNVLVVKRPCSWNSDRRVFKGQSESPFEKYMREELRTVQKKGEKQEITVGHSITSLVSAW